MFHILHLLSQRFPSRATTHSDSLLPKWPKNGDYTAIKYLKRRETKYVFACICICATAEIGDYDEELDCQHLEMKHYVPNQEYLDHKIIKFHKKHRYEVKQKTLVLCSMRTVLSN